MEFTRNESQKALMAGGGSVKPGGCRMKLETYHPKSILDFMTDLFYENITTLMYKMYLLHYIHGDSWVNEWSSLCRFGMERTFGLCTHVFPWQFFLAFIAAFLGNSYLINFSSN